MFNSLYDLVSMLVIRMRSEKGQTMAEYGILIGVIALVVVVAAVLLGGNISTAFNSAATKV
ncbi:MAG: Flp family type IVb pilin [Solirubrobacteraceae bacterium]